MQVWFRLVKWPQSFWDQQPKAVPAMRAMRPLNKCRRETPMGFVSMIILEVNGIGSTLGRFYAGAGVNLHP